jgi:hypothetical protein
MAQRWPEQLEEIEIRGCYYGKVAKFNDWRRALAEMTGVQLSYRVSDEPVSLSSEGPDPPLTHLPFIVAVTHTPKWERLLTPARRRGDWAELPEEPLWILLALNLPAGVIHSRYAGAIAERLREMTELMYAIDNGRYGLFDLGGFTEAMAAGLRRAAEGGQALVVEGGFSSGWWPVSL